MSTERLIKKAYAEARIIIRNKIAEMKGVDYSQLDESAQDSIDQLVAKKNHLIQELAEKRLARYIDALNEEFKGKFKKEEKPKQVDIKGTKKSPVIIHSKFSEETEKQSAVFKALSKKADNSGIDLDILGEVYNRGLEAWDEGIPVTQQQYAFARVNSYINQGRSYFEEDADLHEARPVNNPTYDGLEKAWNDRKADWERMQKKKKEGKPLKEEVSLNEISDKTLRSYIKKAKPDAKDYDTYWGKGKEATKLRNKSSFDYDKAERRAIGTDHANNRLMGRKIENNLKRLHDHLTSNGYTVSNESHRKDRHGKTEVYHREYEKDNGDTTSKVVSRYGQFTGEGKIEHTIHSKKLGYPLWQNGPAVAPKQYHTSTVAHDKITDKHLNSITSADDKYKKYETRPGDIKEEGADLHEATAHERVTKHEAVESVDDGGRGEYFVNLKRGYHWSGQGSFGADSASHALKMLKSVEKGFREELEEAGMHESIEPLEEDFKKGQLVYLKNRPHQNSPHNGRVHKVTDTHVYLNRGGGHIYKALRDNVTADRHESALYKGVKEDLDESKNKPYVKPFYHNGSEKQAGWKASNKHGKVKWYGLDFKKSANKHAGIEEEVETDPSRREVGTDNLTKTYKSQTPGQEEDITENDSSLQQWKEYSEKLKTLVNDYKDFKRKPKEGQKEPKASQSKMEYKTFKQHKDGVMHHTVTIGMDYPMDKRKEFMAKYEKLKHPDTVPVQTEKGIISHKVSREKNNGIFGLVLTPNDIKEEVKIADKIPVVVPSHLDQYGNMIPAKTVLKKTGRKILNTGNPHDGQPGV